MSKTLIIVSLLVVLSLSLKLSEIGRNDWHIENIGELTFVQLVQNKLFYLTEQNVLGHLKVESGEIDSRVTLSQHEKLLSFNQKQVTFITENNQIVLYKTHNLQRQVNNRLVDDKIIRSIKSYIHTLDGNNIIVNDQKNIRSYFVSSLQDQPEQFKDIYTAQPNQIIQKLFYFGKNLYASILKDSIIVIRQIVAEKLSDKEIVPTFNQIDFSQTWSLTQAWSRQGLLVIVLQNYQSNKYQTLVLNQKFITLYQVAKKYNQLIKNQLLFCSKAYDLKSRKQSAKVNIHLDQLLNLEYALEDHADTVQVFKGQQNFVSISKPVSDIKLKHVFIFQKSSYQIYLILQYCDMTLQFHTIQNAQVKKLWTRQEGLAFIDKVLFMKYPFNDHLDNQYHRNLLSQSYLQSNIAERLAQVPFNFALRVKQQLKDLTQLVFKTIDSLLDFSKLGSFNFKDLSKFTMSEEQQIKLGLKKYIIAVTKKGSIYSIDTKTNQLLWKKNRSIKNQQVVSLIDLRKDYELQAAVLITYDSDQNVLIFQEIQQNGNIQLLDRIDCPVLPTIHKLNHESIIINLGDKTMRYQLGQSHAHQKHFYFYTEEPTRIVGWKQIGTDIVQIWNFNLDQGQKVIATAASYRGQQRSHIPLFDNGKVIFKNIDFTNLAILTSKNSTSMSLFILNGMTGQVHFNQFKSGLNLNHPVNLAYDQNNVLVTYYNNRNKLYEIWTVQQYQEKIENSAINMIKDYLQGLQYKPSRNRQNIIFLSEVYGSPVSISKMYISDSKQSLIRRNLIVITRDDKLYIIGRQFVSTRRPKQTAMFSNQVYPPYQYQIPVDPTKYFSYNLRLFGLQNVQFSPSNMESTIYIMAYGIDIYMIRIAPDMPFDMITEDFNYLVLVLIVIAVTVGVLVLRHKAKSAKLFKPHRD